MLGVGQLLRDAGLITAKDLEDAAAAGGRGTGLLSSLIRLGAVDEADMINALGREFDVPVLAAEQCPSPDAVRACADALNVPLKWLADNALIIWRDEESGSNTLCAAGPYIFNASLQEALEQWGVNESNQFLLTPQSVQQVLAALTPSMESAGAQVNADRLREMAEAAPAVDFVSAMLAAASTVNASDVHIEPFEGDMRIRFRIDGLLQDWRSAPRTMLDAVTSRIKLLSGMDIAERRLPQDGRQRVRAGGIEYDVRVATLPTVWGESIVMRFLGRFSQLPSFKELGLGARDEEAFQRMLLQTHGVILVTGPTGSGKTTTVYRMLSELNDGRRKIVTVEEPIEIHLQGALQMHVRTDIGLTFATCLRSILRHDPDIIMIGEIRDAETARIAVQAAMTGHLVISTMHTNSAIGAINRLIDLGVEPFLLADVLRGVVGQRLVRKTLVDAEKSYSGRLGIFEIVEINAHLSGLMRKGASEAEIEEAARRNGFRSMCDEARAKVAEGLTDASEVARVFGIRLQ